MENTPQKLPRPQALKPRSSQKKRTGKEEIELSNKKPLSEHETRAYSIEERKSLAERIRKLPQEYI